MTQKNIIQLIHFLIYIPYSSFYDFVIQWTDHY